MDRKQVMQHMIKELDGIAGFYRELWESEDERDIQLRKNLAIEFKNITGAYNNLLCDVFEVENKIFHREIEKFITFREVYDMD